MIYPPFDQVFSAFGLTPLTNVKVVILGQDPYHGPNQAHGLSFSVVEGQKIPPSLKNIFTELHSDIGGSIPHHGCLESWARQGVLLLNTVLTVEQCSPKSHAKKGWEQFTDRIISHVSDTQDHVVFMLWGKDAQSKVPWLDCKKHLILKAAHPSPLSAYRGFFGCKHFSRANQWLRGHNIDPINWEVR